jgi:L-lactate dehydrogenase complex protein LldG
VSEVWPHVTSDRNCLAGRFADELKLLQGETIRVPTIEEAQRQLGQLIESAGWSRVGAADRPLTRELTARLPAQRVAWATPDWQPRQMADLEAGLVAADALLADTGTCLVTCGTAQERLLCYLPPVCIVVARLEQMSEHLPAAWPDIARRLADPGLRGELLLVTGPSRTSDIEKILILGVHGPKRLVVLLVG